MVTKIVSGGQTGVDRGALDFAIENEIPHGGFCPKSRKSDDWQIPSKYELTEVSSEEYPVRTEMNVQSADGTLIIYKGSFFGRISRGTAQTMEFCGVHGKPMFRVDLRYRLDPQKFADWVKENRIVVLNVAGPSEKHLPCACQRTKEVLSSLFRSL